jgi:AraC-like DNA-binding protein
MKLDELFFVIRFFYFKEEAANFFAPILGADMSFKHIVLANYKKANSIEELAKICCYSLTSFNRSFKQNFNESPYQWLQRRKLQHVINKLSNLSISLSQIVDEFGFSSAGHLTVFCKKYMNVTPSQFRNQLKKNQNH